MADHVYFEMPDGSQFGKPKNAGKDQFGFSQKQPHGSINFCPELTREQLVQWAIRFKENQGGSSAMAKVRSRVPVGYKRLSSECRRNILDGHTFSVQNIRIRFKPATETFVVEKRNQTDTPVTENLTNWATLANIILRDEVMLAYDRDQKHYNPDAYGGELDNELRKNPPKAKEVAKAPAKPAEPAIVIPAPPPLVIPPASPKREPTGAELILAALNLLDSAAGGAPDKVSGLPEASVARLKPLLSMAATLRNQLTEAGVQPAELGGGSSAKADEVRSKLEQLALAKRGELIQFDNQLKLREAAVSAREKQLENAVASGEELVDRAVNTLIDELRAAKPDEPSRPNGGSQHAST